jgi:hypothetical protein
VIMHEELLDLWAILRRTNSIFVDLRHRSPPRNVSMFSQILRSLALQQSGHHWWVC